YRCLYTLHQYIIHMFLKPRTEDNVNQAIAYLKSIYAFGQLLSFASALVPLRSTQYVELCVPFGDHVYTVQKAHAKRKKGGDRGRQLWKDIKLAMKESRALNVYQSVYHSTGFGRQKETEPKKVVSKVFTMINPLGEIEEDPIYEENVESFFMR